VPIKNQAITITYFALDTATGLGKTGDAGNHTIRAVGDGTEFTPAASPAEVDSSLMKGVYKLALTAAEMNYNAVTVHGNSSTSGIVLYPVQMLTERGSIPAAAPGASGGLFIAGTNAATVITTSLTTHFVGTIDTVTTLTGNTAQTGDNFARLGAPAGASIAADIQTRSTYAGGAVASVTGNVGGSVGSVVGAVGSVTAGVALSATGLDAIAITDPGAPANMTTFPKMLVGLWGFFFRKKTMTATQMKLYAADDATVNATAAVSDDGTTQTAGRPA